VTVDGRVAEPLLDDEQVRAFGDHQRGCH